MSTLADVQALAVAQAGQVDQLVALVAALRAANGSLSAADQAAVDSIAADLTTTNGKLAAVIAP